MDAARGSEAARPPAANLPLKLPPGVGVKEIWEGKGGRGMAKRKAKDKADAGAAKAALTKSAPSLRNLLAKAGGGLRSKKEKESAGTAKRLIQLFALTKTIANKNDTSRRTASLGPMLDSMLRHGVYQIQGDPGAMPPKEPRVYRMPRRTDARQRLGTLRVVVRDRTNGQPVAGAALRVQRLLDDDEHGGVRTGLNAGSSFGGNTVSDAIGEVESLMLVGSYRIEATCTGFHPFGGLGERLDAVVEENTVADAEVFLVPIKVGVVVTLFELRPCSIRDMLTAAQHELNEEHANLSLSPTKRSRALKRKKVAPHDRYVTLMDPRSLRATTSYYKAVPVNLGPTGKILRVRHCEWVEDERTGEVKLHARRQTSESAFNVNADGRAFFFARNRYDGMTKPQRKAATARNQMKARKIAEGDGNVSPFEGLDTESEREDVTPPSEPRDGRDSEADSDFSRFGDRSQAELFDIRVSEDMDYWDNLLDHFNTREERRRSRSASPDPRAGSPDTFDSPELRSREPSPDVRAAHSGDGVANDDDGADADAEEDEQEEGRDAQHPPKNVSNAARLLATVQKQEQEQAEFMARTEGASETPDSPTRSPTKLKRNLDVSPERRQLDARAASQARARESCMFDLREGWYTAYLDDPSMCLVFHTKRQQDGNAPQGYAMSGPHMPACVFRVLPGGARYEQLSDNRYSVDSASPAVEDIYTDNTSMRFIGRGPGRSSYTPVEVYMRRRPRVQIRMIDPRQIFEHRGWEASVRDLSKFRFEVHRLGPSVDEMYPTRVANGEVLDTEEVLDVRDKVGRKQGLPRIRERLDAYEAQKGNQETAFDPNPVHHHADKETVLLYAGKLDGSELEGANSLDEMWLDAGLCYTVVVHAYDPFVELSLAETRVAAWEDPPWTFEAMRKVRYTVAVREEYSGKSLADRHVDLDIEHIPPPCVIKPLAANPFHADEEADDELAGLIGEEPEDWIAGWIEAMAERATDLAEYRSLDRVTPSHAVAELPENDSYGASAQSINLNVGQDDRVQRHFEGKTDSQGLVHFWVPPGAICHARTSGDKGKGLLRDPEDDQRLRLDPTKPLAGTTLATRIGPQEGVYFDKTYFARAPAWDGFGDNRHPEHVDAEIRGPIRLCSIEIAVNTLDTDEDADVLVPGCAMTVELATLPFVEDEPERMSRVTFSSSAADRELREQADAADKVVWHFQTPRSVPKKFFGIPAGTLVTVKLDSVPFEYIDPLTEGMDEPNTDEMLLLEGHSTVELRCWKKPRADIRVFETGMGERIMGMRAIVRVYDPPRIVDGDSSGDDEDIVVPPPPPLEDSAQSPEREPLPETSAKLVRFNDDSAAAVLASSSSSDPVNQQTLQDLAEDSFLATRSPGAETVGPMDSAFDMQQNAALGLPHTPPVSWNVKDVVELAKKRGAPEGILNILVEHEVNGAKLLQCDDHFMLEAGIEGVRERKVVLRLRDDARKAAGWTGARARAKHKLGVAYRMGTSGQLGLRKPSYLYECTLGSRESRELWVQPGTEVEVTLHPVWPFVNPLQPAEKDAPTQPLFQSQLVTSLKDGCPPFFFWVHRAPGEASADFWLERDAVSFSLWDDLGEPRLPAPSLARLQPSVPMPLVLSKFCAGQRRPAFVEGDTTEMDRAQNKRARRANQRLARRRPARRTRNRGGVVPSDGSTPGDDTASQSGYGSDGEFGDQRDQEVGVPDLDAILKKRAEDARKDALDKLRMGDPARLPLETSNFLELMVAWGAFYHVGDGTCRACGDRKAKNGKDPAWTDADFLVRPPGGELRKVDESALAQLQKAASNPKMHKVADFLMVDTPSAEEWEVVLERAPAPEAETASVGSKEKDLDVKDYPELREILGFQPAPRDAVAKPPPREAVYCRAPFYTWWLPNHKALHVGLHPGLLDEIRDMARRQVASAQALAEQIRIVKAYNDNLPRDGSALMPHEANQAADRDPYGRLYGGRGNPFGNPFGAGGSSAKTGDAEKGKSAPESSSLLGLGSSSDGATLLAAALPGQLYFIDVSGAMPPGGAAYAGQALGQAIENLAERLEEELIEMFRPRLEQEHAETPENEDYIAQPQKSLEERARELIHSYPDMLPRINVFACAGKNVWRYHDGDEDGLVPLLPGCVAGLEHWVCEKENAFADTVAQQRALEKKQREEAGAAGAAADAQAPAEDDGAETGASWGAGFDIGYALEQTKGTIRRMMAPRDVHFCPTIWMVVGAGFDDATLDVESWMHTLEPLRMKPKTKAERKIKGRSKGLYPPVNTLTLYDENLKENEEDQAAKDAEAAALEAELGPKGSIFAALKAYVAAGQTRFLELFRRVDKDRNGGLDMKELAQLIKIVLPGATDSQIRYLSVMLDYDGSKRVEFREFMEAINDCAEVDESVRKRKSSSFTAADVMRRVSKILKKERITAETLFARYDKRGKGLLTLRTVAKMVKEILPGLTPTELRSLLADVHRLDFNGDGNLSVEEFVKAVEVGGVVDDYERLETRPENPRTYLAMRSISARTGGRALRVDAWTARAQSQPVSTDELEKALEEMKRKAEKSMAFERDFRARVEEDLNARRGLSSDDDGTGRGRRRRRKARKASGKKKRRKGGGKSTDDEGDGRAPSAFSPTRSSFKPTVPRPFKFHGASRLMAGTDGGERRQIAHENVWYPNNFTLPDDLRIYRPQTESDAPRSSSPPRERPQSARPASRLEVQAARTSTALHAIPFGARPSSARMYGSRELHSMSSLPNVGRAATGSFVPHAGRWAINEEGRAYFVGEPPGPTIRSAPYMDAARRAREARERRWEEEGFESFA